MFAKKNVKNKKTGLNRFINSKLQDKISILSKISFLILYYPFLYSGSKCRKKVH